MSDEHHPWLDDLRDKWNSISMEQWKRERNPPRIQFTGPLPENTYIDPPRENHPDGPDVFNGLPRCNVCGYVYFGCIC